MQQKKQTLQLDARSMCWHPLMIKWCLALRQVSPSAYIFIQNSGMIRLPSERTLFDSSQWTNAESGFNTDVLEKLLEEIDIENCKPFEKNVGIIHDEVKIKGDLVFSKTAGQIIGFVNIGDFKNKPSDFENRCEGKSEDPEVATRPSSDG